MTLVTRAHPRLGPHSGVNSHCSAGLTTLTPPIRAACSHPRLAPHRAAPAMPAGKTPRAGRAATPARADRDPNWRRRTIELAAATSLPPPLGLRLDVSAAAAQTTRAPIGEAVTVTATAEGVGPGLGFGILEACFVELWGKVHELERRLEQLGG